jgi:hypothetical protein
LAWYCSFAFGHVDRQFHSHAHREPPPLAVAVAVPGLFQRIDLTLALFSSQPLNHFLLQQLLQVLTNLASGIFLQLSIINPL